MTIKRRYKTIIQRCAAGIIDGILFIPLSYLDDYFAATADKTDFFVWSFIYALIWLFYSVYMHGKYGQTLGKMASTVKVFALDEKNVIGYKKAFLRELIWLIITVCGMIYLYIISYNAEDLSEDTKLKYENFIIYAFGISMLVEVITMLLNAKRRSVHDYMAGSMVLDITKYKQWDFEYGGMVREANEK